RLQKLEPRCLLAAVLVGDFNGDGHQDLAVSAPFRRNSLTPALGSILVYYGPGPNEPFLDMRSLQGQALRPQDPTLFAYGLSMTAGDFDGDGRDDLAVGGRYRSGETQAVSIHYGGAGGLDRAPVRIEAPAGDPAGGDFGQSLRSFDIDDDGSDELAVGRPYENDENEGRIHIFDVDASRAASAAATITFGNVNFGAGDRDERHEFGRHFAFGRLDEETGNASIVARMQAKDRGAVVIIRLSRREDGGLSRGVSQTIFSPLSGGSKDFGASIDIGDLNGDGAADIVVADRLARKDDSDDAVGAVHVFRLRRFFSGGYDPQSAAGYAIEQTVTPLNRRFGDFKRTQTGFASQITLADLDGDGGEELLVAMPRDEETGPDGYRRSAPHIMTFRDRGVGLEEWITFGPTQ
ncbi:MAG: FG-GAP repeat protein, partial [Pseudomonadota bacterium]